MSRSKPTRIVVLGGLLPALICCLAVGCGGKGNRVSGKVTFKGNPVPSGKIYFIPDESKGNSGPTGYADIRNGDYDTSDRGGRGAVAGPVNVVIEANDGSPQTDEKSGEVVAKALFPRYETTADLPDSSSTQNFDVPADAVTPKKQKEFINP
jgi:hypothetical protein